LIGRSNRPAPNQLEALLRPHAVAKSPFQNLIKGYKAFAT
jgi:hypothetical protein